MSGVVWTVWQWQSGSITLIRIYATEQEANAYAAENSYPEHETKVCPYPLIGATL